MDKQETRLARSVEGTEPNRSVPALPISHLRLVEPDAVDLYASLDDQPRRSAARQEWTRMEIAVAVLGVILFVLFVFALNDGKVPL